MKKTVMALLLTALCIGGNTAQAKDWSNAPFTEVQQAAEQGDARAQYLTASMYYYGNGTPQDYRQAAAWFFKVAEQGSPSAQYVLGMMHYDGKGVTQSYRKAAAWYFRSAVQGHAKAQNALGEMYASGNGMAQNFKMAYVWYSVASTNGDSISSHYRDEYAKKLTPEEMADAQILAVQYVEKFQS